MAEKEAKEIVKYENMVVNNELVINYLKAFNIMPNLSEEEIRQCVEVAKAFQLNPFKREIHFIPYQTNEGRRLSIIVGYETYLKRAERSGKLAGWRVWTEGNIKDRTLKAVCEIWRKDWSTSFRHEVLFEEYFRNTQIWREKPYTMLKKIAISQAFRLAFPEELGGIPYTPEEQWEVEVMQQTNQPQMQGEVLTEPQQMQQPQAQVQGEVPNQQQKQPTQVYVEPQEPKQETQPQVQETQQNEIKRIEGVNLIVDAYIEVKEKDGKKYLILTLKKPPLKLYAVDEELIDEINNPNLRDVNIYYTIAKGKRKYYRIVKVEDANLIKVIDASKEFTNNE